MDPTQRLDIASACGLQIYVAREFIKYCLLELLIFFEISPLRGDINSKFHTAVFPDRCPLRVLSNEMDGYAAMLDMIAQRFHKPVLKMLVVLFGTARLHTICRVSVPG